MNRMDQVHGYRGGYLIGWIILGVVGVRTTIFYRGQVSLAIVIASLAIYSLLYALEPWLSSHFRWYKFLYFPLQACALTTLINLRPFTDISSLLVIPLCLQVFRSFSRKAAAAWLVFYAALLTWSVVRGGGWLAGLVLMLLYLAFCLFLISYDLLYSRTQADQAESQRLLADLQSAHRELEAAAAQVEELTATRERNRLAHELHDSVSQAIFGITLTSQSARILMESDPARLPGTIDRLQEMTASALSQLRSLISELRPR